jgi:cell division protein FtsB
MPGPQPAPKPAQPPASQPAAALEGAAQPGTAQPGAQSDTQSGAQAAERARFTSRAAVLAVVLCAIALSLAYPVREYIAQMRQIDQLQAQSAQTAAQLARLQAEAGRLNDPAYIEQQARDRLHYCMPRQTCYVIIGGQPASNAGKAAAAVAGTPWYARLWSSVQQADKQPASR